MVYKVFKKNYKVNKLLAIEESLILDNPFEESLILNNPLNGNSSNYCWLNAPLYAFTVFESIINLYSYNESLIDTSTKKVFKVEDNVNINNISLADYDIGVIKIYNDVLANHKTMQISNSIRIESRLTKHDNACEYWETWKNNIIDELYSQQLIDDNAKRCNSKVVPS